MATGINIRTFFDGRWHDGDLAVMKAADHGMWLGTSVFDGARFVDGIAPDLDRHCARVNASARALMITPTLSPGEMEEIVWDGLSAYPKGAAIYIRPMYWALEGGHLGVLPREGATGFAISLEEIPMPPPGTSTTLCRRCGAASRVAATNKAESFCARTAMPQLRSSNSRWRGAPYTS